MSELQNLMTQETTKPLSEAEIRDRMKEALSMNMKRLMKEQLISVNQLSEWMDVTPNTIRCWKKGKSLPNATKLGRLATFLNINPWDLTRLMTEDVIERDSMDATYQAYTQSKRIIKPLTGILYDYILLGTWMPAATAQAFHLAIMRGSYGKGRMTMERGIIRFDGKSVGHLMRSKGREVEGKKKLLWHFTGEFFRPEGADLLPVDAIKFMHKVVLQVMNEARREVEDRRIARAENDTHAAERDPFANKTYIRSQLTGMRERQSGVIHPEEMDALHLDYERMLQLDDAEEMEQRMRWLTVDWEELTEWPIRMTVIDRWDMCVELELAEGVRIKDMEDVALPHGFDWRDYRESEDGETYYAGPTKNPVADRGTSPMIAFYKKKDGNVRFEVRYPKVTYHKKSRISLGVHETAKRMHDLFLAFLPFDVKLNAEGKINKTPDILQVPILDLDVLPCPVNEDNEPKVKNFSGHQPKEARRLARQGCTLVRRFLAVFVLAHALGHQVVETEMKMAEEVPRGMEPGELVHHKPLDEQDLIEVYKALESYRRLYLPMFNPWADFPKDEEDHKRERELAEDVRHWITERMQAPDLPSWPNFRVPVRIYDAEGGELELVDEQWGEVLATSHT